MLYFVKTPQLLKRLFSNMIWDIPSSEKVIYLTFDDGPTNKVTEWVLSELDKYNAKATFFCIGKNIQNNQDLFQKILRKKHAVGNHTYNHLNNWKVSKKTYLEDTKKCQKTLNDLTLEKKTKLFRPPYGKISLQIAKKLSEKEHKIIMWDVLSGDFDQSITKEKCTENVLKNTTSGSIVVFHDSVKASDNLYYCLPKTLAHFTKLGYVFKSIDT